MSQKRLSGMSGFTIVWIGQVVSLLGTNMTGFGATIWAYEKTGSATALALVGFFFVTPMLIVSPFAGALVDRSNRKFMMMISDLASGAATLLVLTFYLTDHLQIWHLYLTGAVMGTFQSFQWPAYSAAISTMIPKEQYGRANGMMALAESGSGIFAPILAGALLGLIGFGGIMVIDVITFVIAITALVWVHVPQPRRTAEGQKAQGNLIAEAVYGFRYIWERPSLLGLQTIFLLGNFFVSIPFSVQAPMILARTGNNELILGSVNSIGAIGGVVGGLLMSAWGGPKRRVHGVLMGWLLSSLLGVVVIGVGQALPFWAVGSFIGSFFVPLINGSNQAIWQAKVPPDLQGRVFSIRRLIAWFINPLAMLIAGPLADYVLEPAMRSPSALSASLGWLVGVGNGAGMGLMFVACGLAATLVAVGGYLFPAIRNVEAIMPDHDALAEAEPERLQRLRMLLEEREQVLKSPLNSARQHALKRISRQLRELGQPQG